MAQSLKIGESMIVTATAYDSAGVISSPVLTFLPDVPNGVSVVKLTPTTAKVTALAGGVWGVTALGAGAGSGQGSFGGLIPIKPLQPLIVTVVAPVLFTDSLGRAFAMQSPLRTAEPFSVTSPNGNFGADSATRVMLFMGDVDLLPTDTQDMITAEGIDAAGTKYSLPLDGIPHKITVGGLIMWQVIVKLPANLPTGDLRVTITWKGAKSNEGKIAITSSVAVKIVPPTDDLSIDADSVVREILDSHAAWSLLEIQPVPSVQYNAEFFEKNWTTVNYVSSLYGMEFRVLHHAGYEIGLDPVLAGLPHFESVWGFPVRAIQTTSWSNRPDLYEFDFLVSGKFSADQQFLVTRRL